MLEAIENKINKTNLHFSTKKLTINDVSSMLEADGWTIDK